MPTPAPQLSRSLGPGDKLGKYDLIRPIAIGGMAELFLARTVGSEGEKLVVIKRILPQFANNASFVAMFTNEAQLAATFQHPNVARVYDIGLDHGASFFAMEYVHGEDLGQISSQAQEQGVPISLDAALTVITSLCAGLHYAHEKRGPDGTALQIVHRDVSPSNVLVGYDGTIKLIDFGIARGVVGKPTTETGLKGKIVYMSPEQCRADLVIDRRSDIYSVGTMLYELACGRTPFSGETEYAILNQIINADVPRPTSWIPDFPLTLERILLRALARDPEQRYATARDLQTALENFADEIQLGVSPPVLARLMGSLFPARLEEWDRAKSQGAFFVEQHVVQTLMESGKTPDPNEPDLREQVQSVAEQLASDEAALVQEALAYDPLDEIATGVTSAPVFSRSPTPPPVLTRPPTPAPVRASSPVIAVVSRTPTPPPGALLANNLAPSSHAVDIAEPDAALDDDVVRPASRFEATEQVRIVRHPSPTNFIRVKRSKAPIIGIVLLAATAGGIATFIAFGSGSAPVSIARPDPKPDPKPEPAAVVADPPAPRVVADPPPVQTAVEPTPTPDPPKPVPHVTVTHKPAPARPKPHPVAKPKLEEKPAWNADSPFLPVRTDKH